MAQARQDLVLRGDAKCTRCIHDGFGTNDWTADGTRVLPNSQQKIDFFGLFAYFDF